MTYIWMTVGLLLLVALNSWATYRIVRERIPSHLQRVAQFAFVWLLPILGAVLALSLNRQSSLPSLGRYPNDPERPEDIAFTNGPGLTHPVDSSANDFN